jgi:hypothetical protein
LIEIVYDASVQRAIMSDVYVDVDIDVAIDIDGDI